MLILVEGDVQDKITDGLCGYRSCRDIIWYHDINSAD